MIELLLISDPVRLSFLRALLEDAGIKTAVFDASVWPSRPSRLMVPVDDEALARRILQQANEMH